MQIRTHRGKFCIFDGIRNQIRSVHYNFRPHCVLSLPGPTEVTHNSFWLNSVSHLWTMMNILCDPHIVLKRYNILVNSVKSQNYRVKILCRSNCIVLYYITWILFYFYFFHLRSCTVQQIISFDWRLNGDIILSDTIFSRKNPSLNNIYIKYKYRPNISRTYPKKYLISRDFRVRLRIVAYRKPLSYRKHQTT